MANSSLLTDYLGRGPAAARPASITIASGALALWHSTDTDETDWWSGGGWSAFPTLRLNVANSWTAAQRGVPVALTDAATIAVDLALGNNFTAILGGNRSLGNPANIVAGQAGQIVVQQDATGSRTLTFGTDWKFPGGVAPTLSTAANAIDILSYYVIDATHIAVSSAMNFA
jgi:hypothetical protein